MTPLSLFTVLLCTIGVQGLCPDLWIQFGGSCYSLFEDLEAWPQARYVCETYQSHLVTIETSAESHFVENWIKNRQVQTHNVWIGASDLMEEDTFRWIGTNQELGFTDWSPGQPSNLNMQHQHENCVEISHAYHYKWNDKECSLKNQYMCETRPSNTMVG